MICKNHLMMLYIALRKMQFRTENGKEATMK